MDNLTKIQHHKNMFFIKCFDTKFELLVRKTLWDNENRYKNNVKNLSAKPDVRNVLEVLLKIITICKLKNLIRI
ncbi:MAG: hypothetical protein SPL73_00335 [Cyanobacteriota bacterium]|nr:hypothetical protein [Cyanobacteriota bacterium]MDY6358747.1 hypothetical protein [Cyanobacteriota bacterium]MDY6363320.1 hypothetical protein [Cyanobacteriota bacterium]